MRPYSFSLANQPLPSVIFLKVPILRLAASMPSWFMSSPDMARSSTPLSPSSVWPKCTDCCLSCFAISRRLEVSVSCSLRLCERSASVLGRSEPPVVAAAFDPNREFPLAVCAPCASSALPLRRMDEVKFSAAFRSASLPSLDVVTSLPASACTRGAYDGNWSASSSSESIEASDSVSSSWLSSYIRWLSCLMSSRFCCRSACSACFLDLEGMVDAECSRLRRSVRACSMFYVLC
jgi:hypothetical protein